MIFLSFFHYLGNTYGYALGFIFKINKIMETPSEYANYIESEIYVVYLVVIILIVFLLSGIVQLIGLASRIVAIISSTPPIIVSLLIILIRYGVLGGLSGYRYFLTNSAILDGIFPFDIPFGNVSLGTYTILAGGVLVLIGGILGSKEF